MAATALIVLTQGASSGAGVALSGVASVLVTVTNQNNTDVGSWEVELVYTPPGGAVSPAVIGGANNNSPLATFTPSTTPGSYRIMLTVWPAPGQVGTPDIDIRCFSLPEPAYGFIYPPYQGFPAKLPPPSSGLPGAKPDEMNFNGQPYGWDGFGNDGLLLDFMRTIAATLGSGGGAPTSRLLTAGAGLLGGGDLSADRAFAVDFGTGGTQVRPGNDAAYTNDRTASGVRSASTVVSVSGATAPTAGQVLTAVNTTTATWQTPAAGTGDVVGPASAVSGRVATFNGTTGKLIQDGAILLSSLVQNTRALTAGTGLTGGGDLSADRSFAVAFGSSGTTACVGNDSRLSNARTPTTHATSHQDGGSDEIVVTGLSGLLADPQLVTIAKAGTNIGTRAKINFIEGTNVTLGVADNSGAGRVDITVTSSGGSSATDAQALWSRPTSPNANDYEFALDSELASVEFYDETNAVARIPSGVPDRSSTITGTSVPKHRLPSSSRPSWYQFQCSTTGIYFVTVPLTNALPTNCFIWARGGINRINVGSAPSRLQLVVAQSTGGHVDTGNFLSVGTLNNAGSPSTEFRAVGSGVPANISFDTDNTYDYMGLWKQGSSWTAFLWNEGMAPLSYASMGGGGGFTATRVGFRCKFEILAVAMVDFIRQAPDPSLVFGG